MASFTVFLSYKENDKDAVITVKKALEEYARDFLRLKPSSAGGGAGDVFDVFLASDTIKIGTRWREALYERLTSSDLFVLFYTTPGTDWSWCMFEAGMFISRAEGTLKKPVCLHTAKDKPPKQLEYLQAKPVTREQVRTVLVGEIFDAVGYAEGRSPDEGRLAALVDKVLAVFRPYEKLSDVALNAPRVLLPRMRVQCHLRHLDTPRQIGDAIVTFEAGAGAMFNQPDDSSVTLSALKDVMPERAPFLKAVEDALGRAMESQRTIEPMQVVLDVEQRGGGGVKIFRPILTRAGTSSYRDAFLIDFDIYFAELLDDRSDYAPELDRCFKLLRIIHSFRVNIAVRRYEMSVPQQWSVARVDDLVREMTNILSRDKHFNLRSGADPLAGLDAGERAELAALGERFSTCIGMIVKAEGTALLKLDWQWLANSLDAINMAWLRSISSLYGRIVEQTAAKDPPKQKLRFVRIAIILNGNRQYATDVRDAFVREVQSQLSRTYYVPVFSEIEGFAEQSNARKNVEKLDELVRSFRGDVEPDYLVSIGTQVSKSAYEHYLGKIPLIFASVTDPVKAGLVKGLKSDKDRGNICGVTFGRAADERLRSIATIAKAIGRGERLGFIYNPDYEQDVAMLERTRDAARKMNPPVEVVEIDVATPYLTIDHLNRADLFFGWDYLDTEIESFKDYARPFVIQNTHVRSRNVIAVVSHNDNAQIGFQAAKWVLKPNLDGKPLWEIPIKDPTTPTFRVDVAAARNYCADLPGRLRELLPLTITTIDD